jgi:REP element-mobilizing transposase RayT
MDPLYTPANCVPAYQLRWSLSLFSTAELPSAAAWSEAVRESIERDGVRLLEQRFYAPNVWQFLLSTRPDVAPPAIVKSVKGRLQHLVQGSCPSAFRRNVSLTSIGDAKRETVEAYIANQLGHHRMADPRVQQRLAAFQLSFPAVDLSIPQFSSHGRYLYNLHLVLVHEDRWCDVSEDRLTVTNEMIQRVAAKKGHRLSRAAILADHLHLALGCWVDESPDVVALAYLNNLAYTHGMQPIYQFSYFVGTFGEYDIEAVRRAL